MTKYTALGGDWGIASDWDGDVVPNSPDADVVLSGAPDGIAVTIANEIFAVRSISIDDAILTIDGFLDVSQSVTLAQNSTLALGGGQLTASAVVLGSASDALHGWGTINGNVVDNGMISAGARSSNFENGLSGDDLVINGDVSGNGVLTITGGVSNPGNHVYFLVAGEIELNGASANDVVFAGAVGALQLDKPSEFTGTVSVPSVFSFLTAAGEEVYGSFSLMLEGVSLGSVTNYAYSGGSDGGVLTINTPGGDYSYKFAGTFETSDFALSAQSGAASPSLVVTVTPKVTVTPNPIISGTVSGQQITSEQMVRPFSDIVITDTSVPNTNYVVAVVRLSGGAGTWSNLGSGAISYENAYSVGGDLASVVAALHAVVFTPTSYSITAGAAQTITFTVDYSDFVAQDVTDSTTTVVVTGTTLNIAQSGITINASNTLVTFTAAADYDTVVGDDDTILSPPGMTLTVSGVGDAVYLSSGRVYLDAHANVSTVGDDDSALAAGAGDVMGFVGVGDVAYISQGTVYLGGASNVVIVGDDDVANTSAAGDVMGFYGIGDVAEISHGTVYLGATTRVVIEGNDDVANTAAAGDVMGFDGTGDVAEITDGTVNLTAASSVAIFGDNDIAHADQPGATMTFTGARDTAQISNGTVGLLNATVALVGANNTIALAPLFGLDTLHDFDASDQLQFSHQDFTSVADVLAATVQSGSDTLITFDANDALRLTNVTALSAAQIVIV